MDDWTSQELAEAAGISRRWINQLCAQCAADPTDPACPFPGVRMRSNAWFIPRREGQAWLDARTARESPQES